MNLEIVHMFGIVQTRKSYPKLSKILEKIHIRKGGFDWKQDNILKAKLQAEIASKRSIKEDSLEIIIKC